MRTNKGGVSLMALALIGMTSAPAPAAAALLADNHPAQALSQPSLGNADANLPLTMEIRFELRNSAQLDQLLVQQQDPASPNYHQWLKSGEFDQRFGPRPEDVSAVANWLTSEGFTVASASDEHLEFSGNVAQAQRSFAVRIARYGDGTIYANVEDPTVPPQFDGIIGAITGLDNMMQTTPVGLSFAAPLQASSPEAIINMKEAFGPQDIRTFYDETVTAGTGDGTGSCIAIVGESEISPAALSAFNNQFGLPANTLSQLSKGKIPGETQNNNEVEAELDVEWSHAVAPGAAQKLFLGSGADALGDSISDAIRDNGCSVVSISFGYCSAPKTQFTKVLDPQFKKAAAQGQSVFVSSGDQGAAALEVSDHMCVPSDKVGISELSANPLVTAVGRTQSTPNFDVNGNDVGYSQESTWNTMGAKPGASGGGASAIFTKPAFQKGPGVPNDSKRDTPDIALQASPVSPGVFLGDAVNEPAQITCCIGGTSLSAPLMASFILLIDQQVNARLGSMNPLYYQLANQQYGPSGTPEGFHDITTGNNNFGGVTGFNAGPGYDQTTGWGSIDFNVFAAAVKAVPPQTGPLTFPKTVAFGAHKVGTPPVKAKVIILSNPAKNKNPAILSADAVLGNTTDFTMTASNCTKGAVIAAGKSCSVSVQFTPQTASKAGKVGLLTFADNASNSPQVVTLTGKGTAATGKGK